MNLLSGSVLDDERGVTSLVVNEWHVIVFCETWQLGLAELSLFCVL